MTRNVLKRAMVVWVILATAALAGIGQTWAQGTADSNRGAISVLPVRGNVYMLVGGGGNVTVSAGRDGALVVDTGSARMANQLVATIQQIVNAVNTSPVPASACVGSDCGGGSSVPMVGPAPGSMGRRSHGPQPSLSAISSTPAWPPTTRVVMRR